MPCVAHDADQQWHLIAHNSTHQHRRWPPCDAASLDPAATHTSSCHQDSHAWVPESGCGGLKDPNYEYRNCLNDRHEAARSVKKQRNLMKQTMWLDWDPACRAFPSCCCCCCYRAQLLTPKPYKPTKPTCRCAVCSLCVHLHAVVCSCMHLNKGLSLAINNQAGKECRGTTWCTSHLKQANRTQTASFKLHTLLSSDCV
jgi:hypothetical protein